MKKVVGIILLGTIMLVGIVKVEASSGQLRKASITTCNGVTYGQHSSDNHWHVAEEKDGKYYATGDPIYGNPCNGGSTNDKPSDGGSTSNDTSNNNTTTKPSDGGSTSNDTSNNNTTTKPSDGSSTSNNNTTKPSNGGSTSNQNNDVPKEEPKNSDNTLKTILIEGESIEVSDKIEYSTTKSEIKIEVIPNDEKATFEIKNNGKLSVGKNTISIEVTAENGKTKTYEIVVDKKIILSSNTEIEITIDGEPVQFSNKKATVYVSSSATSVAIDYKLSDDKAKVNIDKLDKLKTGDNNLKVEVEAEDGTKVLYEITIHKYTKAEDTISTIIAFVMLGGFGYGIYFVIKKGKNLFKKIKK